MFIMTKTFWPKALKLNIHAPGTGMALIILALTQVPVAIESAAEVACIAEVSNITWKRTNTHKGVNPYAVRFCKGGSR